MSTSDHINPFDVLPPEMIWYIFNYLDLDTLKSISLTCRRLERIFSNYCCSRFMLHIGFDDRYIPHPKHPNRARAIKGSVESVVKTLKHSTRYYQNVHMFVHLKRIYPDEMCMNSIPNKVLGTDWLPQLVILKLTMGHDSYKYANVMEITAAVNKMDRLQELEFLYTKEFLASKQNYSEELKIENNNLQRLVLEITLPSVINCPKLRKLDVAYHLDAETHFGKQYAQYGDEEPYWKVKQLEEFTITNPVVFSNFGSMEHRPGYKFKFYQHLIQLKKLHIYEGSISEKFFQSVCESCVHLEDLFISNFQAINANSLRYLSNLKHLRRLGIWRCFKTISFDTVTIPKLEHLTLRMVDVLWTSLEPFQSIKSLSVRENSLQGATLLLRRMKLLEFLWLDFFDMRLNCVNLKEIFLDLQQLPLLRMLILQNLRVPDYFPLMSPLPQVKRLVLFKCRTDRNLRAAASLFPNVKRIEQEIPQSLACTIWYAEYLSKYE